MKVKLIYNTFPPGNFQAIQSSIGKRQIIKVKRQKPLVTGT